MTGSAPGGSNGGRDQLPIQLLARLIDDAGVFPPAALSLPDAVAEHGRLLAGPHAPVVGQLLVRASQLDQLTGSGYDPSWPVGVVADTALDDAVAAVRASAAHVVQFELPLGDGDDTGAVARSIAPLLDTEVRVYVEAAGSATMREQIGRIAGLAAVGHVRAKLRTGGTTAAATPPAATVAGFICACHEAGLAWKATAGLHHPLRHWERTVDGPQHGFLNIIAATAAAQQGGCGADLERIVLAEHLDDLVLPRTAGAALAVRAALRSFGSCSITEPLAGLRALHLLPAT